MAIQKESKSKQTTTDQPKKKGLPTGEMRNNYKTRYRSIIHLPVEPQDNQTLENKYSSKRQIVKTYKAHHKVD